VAGEADGFVMPFTLTADEERAYRAKIAVSEQARRQSPSRGGEAATTQGAAEAARTEGANHASFTPPPERPWESLFRFDLLHDTYGLKGWPE
jgi:hypothetical protein